MAEGYKIAVVGATGAFGEELIRLLAESELPVAELRLFDGAPSEDAWVEFRDTSLPVVALAMANFAGVDLVFLGDSAAVSRELAPLVRAAGALCIDASGAWSAEAAVPLVVDALNPEALTKSLGTGLVAVPLGSSVHLTTLLAPLHATAGLRRVVVTSCEAVAGLGPAAIDELRTASGELLNGRPAEPKLFPHRIAFNALPQVGDFSAAGTTTAEMRLTVELRTLLGEAALPLAVTALRLPLFYGDSATLAIETVAPLGVERARELLAQSPGCEVVDAPQELLYPLPSEAAGQDLVLVGRLRDDRSVAQGLTLFSCADNLRLAAHNAVQVAARLLGAR